MGYGSIAKGLASTVGNTALDAVPGGKAVKSIIKSVGSLFGGGGNKWDKSLRETRAAGKAGDVATLQYKLANTKYPQVAKSAKAYLDVLLAKSTGSRSDGWLTTKIAAPTLIAGAGPMGGTGVINQGSQSLPLPSPGSRRRRRKRRSSYRSHSRKSRSHSRKSYTRRRKTTTHHRRKRKLKFGSRAWRMKYLGHK
jgi:hypothetical protein